jgi:two-component system, NarL family, response regulator DegU
MNILIVDDNARMRQAIISMLASADVICIECDNGADAIILYQQIHPDLVLMDIKIPGINGITTTKNIVSKYPDARVVIVTDYNDAEFRAAAKHAGAMNYILKEEMTKLKDICVQPWNSQSKMTTSQY